MQVLVHGEATVMARLKAALLREYEDNQVPVNVTLLYTQIVLFFLASFERYSTDFSVLMAGSGGVVRLSPHIPCIVLVYPLIPV